MAAEQYPLPTRGSPGGQSVSESLRLSAELSTAAMLLLERLTPEEGVAFLLSDVFNYNPAEIADALGKHEDACRQLAHRARNLIREDGREQLARALRPT